MVWFPMEALLVAEGACDPTKPLLSELWQLEATGRASVQLQGTPHPWSGVSAGWNPSVLTMGLFMDSGCDGCAQEEKGKVVFSVGNILFTILVPC